MIYSDDTIHEALEKIAMSKRLGAAVGGGLMGAGLYGAYKAIKGDTPLRGSHTNPGASRAHIVKLQDKYRKEGKSRAVKELQRDLDRHDRQFSKKASVYVDDNIHTALDKVASAKALSRGASRFVFGTRNQGALRTAKDPLMRAADNRKSYLAAIKDETAKKTRAAAQGTGDWQASLKAVGEGMRKTERAMQPTGIERALKRPGAGKKLFPSRGIGLKALPKGATGSVPQGPRLFGPSKGMKKG